MALLDDKLNIINNGNYRSLDKEYEPRNDAYHCSHCFKIFFEDHVDLKKRAINHAKRCTFRMGKDGVNIITKEVLPKEEQFKWSHRKSKISFAFDRLGQISKKIQGIDFPITDCQGLVTNALTSFVYIEDGRPLGLITVGNVKIESTPKYEYLSVNDFCVLTYAQRRGIGKKLFDAMLIHCKKNLIELAYNRPSFQTVEFLKKWYGLESNDLMCWG